MLLRVLHKQEQSIIKTRDFDLENNLTLVVMMTAVETWKRNLSRLFWRGNGEWCSSGDMWEQRKTRSGVGQ
jgi:hypothetical protein